MADIPNRNTVFPAWANFQENLVTKVAIMSAPELPTLNMTVAERNAAGIPTDMNNPLMPTIGFDIPSDAWVNHNEVIANGDQYPEQFTADVPTGKKLTINGGPRWFEVYADEKAKNRDTVVNPTAPDNPDDMFFIDVAAGGKLDIKADALHGQNVSQTYYTSKTEQSALAKPIGGRNWAIVTGAGTVTADMGKFGNNAAVTADKSTFTMGNGKSFYNATGQSTQGHHVTAGTNTDVFQYDFSAGVPTNIGPNTFDAGLGSTEPSNADGIQLRNLPNGSKVTASVSAIRGSGTFKDSDVTLTIKNPAGATIGTIAATNLNYVNLIYADGTVQGFAPQTIGAGGTKTYNIGTTAPKAASLNSENLAAAARSFSGNSDVAANEPSVAPVNLATPVAQQGAGVKIGG